MRRLLAAVVILAAPGHAQTAAVLDARLAQAIAAGCAAHASSKMQSEAIAVVDPGGHLVAGLRMDHTGSGMMEFGIAKAKAAAAWGFSTAEMARAVKGTPGFANAPQVVTVAGGIPVYDAEGKLRIGAVGVSGEAPSDDASCAEAGVRAAGLRSTHS